MSYSVEASDLIGIADAIRAKGGTSDKLVFPDGFISAVNAIEAGESGITPSGTVAITDNGTVDVTNYASANVKVSKVFYKLVTLAHTATTNEIVITRDELTSAGMDLTDKSEPTADYYTCLRAERVFTGDVSDGVSGAIIHSVAANFAMGASSDKYLHGYAQRQSSATAQSGANITTTDGAYSLATKTGNGILYIDDGAVGVRSYGTTYDYNGTYLISVSYVKK